MGYALCALMASGSLSLSNKTRIETPTSPGALILRGLVLYLYPIKQGLKHLSFSQIVIQSQSFFISIQ